MSANLINHISRLILVIGPMFLLAACSTAPVQETVDIHEPAQPDSKTTQPAALEEHDLNPTYAAQIADERDSRIPDLPFADNPDPSQCGIPVPWGLDDPAWLNGIYKGDLIQPVVFLYGSHLRLSISGEAPHGSQVTIKLFQENPVVDYYMVEVIDAGEPIQGWVPAPLLSFDPVEPLS